ncbi:MAG: PAS domain S-box protein [Deltaproteobacteria bacterium]|nr:PAS domain S-box protein [Deltaproteobacteria bacterium]
MESENSPKSDSFKDHPGDLNKFRELMDMAPYGVIVHRELKPLYTNRMLRRMFGFSAENPFGKNETLLDMVVAHERERILAYNETHTHSGSQSGMSALTCEVYHADGSRFWTSINSRGFSWEGRPAVLSTFMDVTSEKEARKELEKSEQKYRNLVEGAFEGICLFKNGEILFANEALAKIFGYEHPEQIKGKQIREIIQGDDLDSLLEMCSGTAEECGPKKIRIKTKEGEFSSKTTEARLKKIEVDRQSICQMTMVDITDYEDTKQRLDLLSQAVNQAGDLVFITDAEGVILYVNKAFEKTTGYSAKEAVGQTPRILNSGKRETSAHARMWRCIKSGQVWAGNHTNRRKNGSLIEVDAVHSPIKNENGEITHFIAVHHDITERFNMEIQLRQIQKMEAVGQLAGGLAHEFNNLLQVMRGYSELAQRNASENPKLIRDLTNIQKAVDKATELTHHLLDFTRRRELQTRLMDINDLMESLLHILKSLVGEQIDIQTAFEQHLPQVFMDPVMIEQVIINLCANARDAMPSGGVLEIHTRLVFPSKRISERFPHLSRTWCVEVTVRDNGQGIPPSIVEHIFNPFYTTKTPGEGTGLGLSTSYGIIEHHRGAIDVTTKEGQGSEFRVLLPVEDEAMEEAGREISAANQKRYRILVAEDDSGVLNYLMRLLEIVGHDVHGCANGEEALEVFQEKDGNFDLVILDMLMPKINGPDLFLEMVKLTPGLPVIFCSGHIIDLEDMLPRTDSRYLLLRKPYRQDDLKAAIRAVMGSTNLEEGND